MYICMYNLMLYLRLALYNFSVLAPIMFCIPWLYLVRVFYGSLEHSSDFMMNFALNMEVVICFFFSHVKRISIGAVCVLPY